MVQHQGPEAGRDIVIITGPAGAGRSTAIHALEDFGFEAIDNLPISLLPRLFAGPPMERPVVVGIDPRNRDFDVAALMMALGEVETVTGRAPILAYLDCDVSTLMRRYSETRRRHPLSPQDSPRVGIAREVALLTPLREMADVLIDTSAHTPHSLRAVIAKHFDADERLGGLAITLHSFSYKRGIPQGIDMVMDVRFLRNPHWEPALRGLDGRAAEVRDFVSSDPRYAEFDLRLTEMLRFLLPAYRDEGKSYFALGIGCTGGRHRSVALVETLAKALAEDGWHVSIRHRELERAQAASAPELRVTPA